MSKSEAKVSNFAESHTIPFHGIQPGKIFIDFFVPGLQKTAGSKKSFRHRHTGKIVTVDDSGSAGAQWRSDVKRFAELHRPPQLLAGPLALLLTFYVMRPKGHFGTGRNAGILKPSAPRHPTVKPDNIKMTRAVEDALTGVIWKDDSQIVKHKLEKLYGPKPGVRITIFDLT